MYTATSWANRMALIAWEANQRAPSAETRSAAVACEVPRSSVDPDLVEATERTVRMASRSLGLDPAPRLRWLPADVKRTRGIVFDDALTEAWVRVQDPDKAKETALHEVRHVWQLRGDRYKSLGLDTYEKRQRDADEFARTWDPFAAPVLRKEQPMLRSSVHPRNPYPNMPKREIWQHKGITYVTCDQCDEGVPLNTTHHCPVATAMRSAGGKFAHVPYHVKAL